MGKPPKKIKTVLDMFVVKFCVFEKGNPLPFRQFTDVPKRPKEMKPVETDRSWILKTRISDIGAVVIFPVSWAQCRMTRLKDNWEREIQRLRSIVEAHVIELSADYTSNTLQKVTGTKIASIESCKKNSTLQFSLGRFLWGNHLAM